MRPCSVDLGITMKTNLFTSFFTKVLFVSSLFILSCNAYSIDMFLELEGFKGESQNDEFKEQIDVLAFSEGGSNTTSVQIEGGGGAGKANFQDLSLVKWLDASSPLLRLALAQGEVIPSATLSVVRPGGQKPFVFFKIELKNVVISSIASGGSGGEDRLTENLTLTFAEIKWTYFKQDDTGALEDTITRGWNIRDNVPL